MERDGAANHGEHHDHAAGRARFCSFRSSSGSRIFIRGCTRSVMAATAELRAKAVYLSQNFSSSATYGYFLLWSIWIFAIYRQSTKQDTEKSVRQMHIASRWSAPGLFLVVAVGTLASYDWLMSLEPGWYSTIFGLYYSVRRRADLHVGRDAGVPGLPARGDSDELDHHGALSRPGQVAVRADGVLYLHGVLAIPVDLVREHSGRDDWYRHRMVGAWLPLALAMPFLRFIIPFFVLLCRPAKRSLKMIGFIAAWSMVVEVHRAVLDRDAGVIIRMVRRSTGWISRRSQRPSASAAWCSGAGSGGTRWCRWAICDLSRGCILRMRSVTRSAQRMPCARLEQCEGAHSECVVRG